MKTSNLRTLLAICFPLIYYSAFGQILPILPLEDAHKKQEAITTKEFIESFTYIPLETSPQCLIGANPKIKVTEKYIVITDQQNQCLLFDKVSGKFIRQIGHYGKDPGGYKSTYRVFFNEGNSTLYLSGWKNDLMKYSLDGKAIGSVPIPNFNSSFTDTFMPDNYDYMNNNLIACNIINTDGLQKTLIMIFDENGKVVKNIPNRDLQKEHKFSISIGDMNFFHYNSNLLYNEIFNDTIFNLQPDKVVPYMILKRGKYRLTRETRGSEFEKISPRTFLESEKFISFDFSGIKNKTFFALYNKSISKLKICEFTSGIKNDTDGFVPFLPKTILKEELAGLVQAADLNSWFEINIAMKDKLPPEIKKLSALKITDNPVVVIAKLKK